MHKTPTLLIILDGFGLSDAVAGNAITAANTPCLDRFCLECASTALSASGEDVGLPAGQIGNSQSGHMNIGAGRVVLQDQPRIDRAIRDGSFFQNDALLRVMEHCRVQGTALHLAGLLSDGGVHSRLDHLFALLRMARDAGLNRVYLHAFLDGRNAEPYAGLDCIQRTEAVCRELGVGKIATIMGRRFAMDREGRWDLVERAYDAMVYGENGGTSPRAEDAVRESYWKGVTDEYVEPVVCDPEGTLSDQDGVIFFNYRPDRIRELCCALTEPDFDGFTRQYFALSCVSLTEYDIPGIRAAFPRQPIRNALGEYLSGLGLRQLRIAEAERYEQVTAFFNGGAATVFPGEERILIPSSGLDYSLHPEMSAAKICENCVKSIESGEYDVIVVDFANCDMVSHTGSFSAVVKAVETVDACTGRIVDAALKMGGIALITASHGNAEEMFRPDGSLQPGGTGNPVPFLLCGAGTTLRQGRLADVAPTLLDVMGLECPEEMDGKTLIEA